jgi:carbohydrate-binding DOMON domain-containing protein
MTRLHLAAAAVAALLGTSSFAQEVSFKDPVGDDKGPGKYTYPTDVVYKPGSFDLTGFKLGASGGKATLEVSVNSDLEDPWRMGTGFAVQMVFVFIKTGEGGHTETLPGLNAVFAPEDAWNKVVILSPQSSGRVKTEVQQKAAAVKGDVVVPTRVKGSGRTISATVDLKELGSGDPTKWGYQVVMQSNEGFPTATDLLTRKVNEYEGQHRFGGGTDTDCDPHIMDILGDLDAQKAQLAYECNADGTAKKKATLRMVRK